MIASKYKWVSQQGSPDVKLIDTDTDYLVAIITTVSIHSTTYAVRINNNPVQDARFYNLPAAQEYVIMFLMRHESVNMLKENAELHAVISELKQEVSRLTPFEDAIIHLNNALQYLNNRK